MVRKQLIKTIDKAQALWCEMFHDQAMWPINGRYQCRTCLRYTAVPWETPGDSKKNSGQQHAPSTLRLVSTRSASH
jgi:hypothetical protein